MSEYTKRTSRILRAEDVKFMRSWMEKWGSVLIIFLCALIILFSALYTRQDDLRRIAAQNAAASQDETLSGAARYSPPVGTTPTQIYRGAYKTAAGIWQMDPHVYYAVQKGDSILSCADGTITQADTHTMVLSAEDYVFRLTGDFLVLTSACTSVTAGQIIARAAQSGTLLLSLQSAGQYLDPLSLFTP